jgi:hypothetical protein
MGAEGWRRVIRMRRGTFVREDRSFIGAKRKDEAIDYHRFYNLNWSPWMSSAHAAPVPPLPNNALSLSGHSRRSPTEMITWYALQCMERLILDGKKSIDVKQEAYWRYNKLVDERNWTKVWADPRAQSYYWTHSGRTATQNPFGAPEMWHFLRKPDLNDMKID